MAGMHGELRRWSLAAALAVWLVAWPAAMTWADAGGVRAGAAAAGKLMMAGKGGGGSDRDSGAHHASNAPPRSATSKPPADDDRGRADAQRRAEQPARQAGQQRQAESAARQRQQDGNRRAEQAGRAQEQRRQSDQAARAQGQQRQRAAEATAARESSRRQTEQLGRLEAQRRQADQAARDRDNQRALASTADKNDRVRRDSPNINGNGNRSDSGNVRGDSSKPRLNPRPTEPGATGKPVRGDRLAPPSQAKPGRPDNSGRNGSGSGGAAAPRPPAGGKNPVVSPRPATPKPSGKEPRNPSPTKPRITPSDPGRPSFPSPRPFDPTSQKPGLVKPVGKPTAGKPVNVDPPTFAKPHPPTVQKPGGNTIVDLPRTPSPAPKPTGIRPTGKDPTVIARNPTRTPRINPRVIVNRHQAPVRNHQIVFGRHFYDPIVYRHSYCDPFPRWNDDFDRFGFYYSGSHFSLSFGFSNYYTPYYRSPYFWYYDHFGYPRPVWGASYGWNDGCWDDANWYYYGRPVYGYYRPRFDCYRPVYHYSYSGYSYLGSSAVVGGYDGYQAYGSTVWPGDGSSGVFTPATREYAPSAPPENGWDLLSAGDVREASRWFDRAIDAYPSDGLPKIGYALTAALLHHEHEAIVHMRRALRKDPDAIRAVPRDGNLDAVMRRLLDEWQGRSDADPDDEDPMFMVAALQYMLGDVDRAHFAIDRAMSNGDDDDSTVNLRALIRAAMEAAGPVPPASTSPPYAPINEPAPPPPTAPTSPPARPLEVPY